MGRGLTDDAICGYRGAAGDGRAGSVKKREVDPKAHPEGVNAATARDQQTRSRSPGPQERQPEQAGEEGDRHRHPMRSDLRGGEPAEAIRVSVGGHGGY